MIRNLEKHEKYESAYKPNDFYWGIGVEHETYIKTAKYRTVTFDEIKQNRAPERYSVDYYSIYNKSTLNTVLDDMQKEVGEIEIPILMNSHTLTKTDLQGEHQLTYETNPKPNPLFSGKTIVDWLKEQNPHIFEKEYNYSYMFDGDTVEFMTQQFYKANVSQVLEELESIENKFINALNDLPKKGILAEYAPYKIAPKNYGFASYLTNLKNVAMFNNGTIHINITLPTQLNADAKIADFDKFRQQHQSYARALQWISPLLIAKYGSPDPFSDPYINPNAHKFAAGSQRVAVSRYIGLGTYDTDKMEIGKILTKQRKHLNIGWYNSFHNEKNEVCYKFYDELGMDINFNKHYCHGIELRIFDAVSIEELREILELVVYLGDFSLDNSVDMNNPVKSIFWQKMAENCVHYGKRCYIDADDQHELYNIFLLNLQSLHDICTAQRAALVLDNIHQALKEKYKNSQCAKYMLLRD